MCLTLVCSSKLSFGVCRGQLVDRPTGSSIDWHLSSMELACCGTTTRRARAIIDTREMPKSLIVLLIRTRCWRISGVTSKSGGDEMKTVTLQVAKLEEVKRQAQDAFKGKKQGSRISFATPE